MQSLGSNTMCVLPVTSSYQIQSTVYSSAGMMNISCITSYNLVFTLYKVAHEMNLLSI